MAFLSNPITQCLLLLYVITASLLYYRNFPDPYYDKRNGPYKVNQSMRSHVFFIE